MWRFFRRLQRTEGQSTVLLAGAMTALMGLAAIVTDVSIVMMEKQRLQNAVDVAVLTAGQNLPNTAVASSTAATYVTRNAANAASAVTFPTADSVKVTASSTVNYTFARMLGFTSATVEASAEALTGRIGQALDYTLFSGSQTIELQTNGQNIYFEGNAHTNKNFVANGQGVTITGRCEAVTTFTSTGAQIKIPYRFPNSPYVPMPDFSDLVKTKAQAGGTYYVGNKTFSSGQTINVDSSVYVEGNLTINGSRFIGKGTIVATGNILFNGNGQKSNAADAIAFYSKNGNVTIQGNRLTIDGILYAPKGRVFMDGNNQTVHGRVIGNTVGWNGSDFNIFSSANDINALPSTGVKLIH